MNTTKVHICDGLERRGSHVDIAFAARISRATVDDQDVDALAVRGVTNGCCEREVALCTAGDTVGKSISADVDSADGALDC